MAQRMESELDKCTLTKTVYDALEAQRQARRKRYQSPGADPCNRRGAVVLNAIPGAAGKAGTVHPSDLT